MDTGQSGIIYASTRKEAERICHSLENEKTTTKTYHGDMSEQLRSESQKAFLYDQVQVTAATNASGMGINKSNVRFVTHVQVLGGIGPYYQEASRVGRDGLPNGAVLVFAPQDLRI